MDKISIIVPCYNEQQILPCFYESIIEVSNNMSEQEFELIFINDGSQDSTLHLIKEFSHIDKRVKYISFSRNFGKEAGIYAGLQHVTGDYVVIMDADLQDPPNLLPEMYMEIKKGIFDCVATRRIDREGEPPLRSFFAKKFYKLINKISDINIVDGARDFRMMTIQMADSIISLDEYNRFSKGIFNWVGFEVKWLEYKNVGRKIGKSKWSFGKLFCYSMEGIAAFSTVPLAIASVTGIAFCFIALVLICLIIFRTLIYGDPVAGWPSLVCIIFAIGGLQLFCIGILGQYLAKTYLEAKRRPIYIIKESNSIRVR